LVTECGHGFGTHVGSRSAFLGCQDVCLQYSGWCLDKDDLCAAKVCASRPPCARRSTAVRWVPAAEVLGYTMDRSMRIRISDFLTRDKLPVVN
jgi:hypothetical protein